jgi:3D (Asp-Asp-Asp) domain-containing protein
LILRLFADFDPEGWNFCAPAGKNHHRQDGPADMNKFGKHIFNATLPLLCLLLAGAAPLSPAPAPLPPELLHDDTSSAPVAHVVWMEVTAYCPCTKCCGPNAHGITASGRDVSYNGGVFVAADTDQYSFGTKLSIPGYHDGQAVEVIDRGSAIKGDHLDVFFPTHQQALEWGRQRLPVTIVQ